MRLAIIIAVSVMTGWAAGGIYENYKNKRK